MSELSTEKRGPGRPPRQQEVQAVRRRRQELGDDRLLKLSVPKELQDPNFKQRWFNDVGGRIKSKTEQDDWDIVRENISGDGEGTPVRRVVGANATGQPIYAYLCQKPVEFFREDKAKEQAAIKAVEDGLKRGEVSGADALSSDKSYVPGGKNIIGD